MITIILLGVLIGLFFYYLFALKSRYEYFARHNIPGPPPKFFFGNYMSLWTTPFFHHQIPEWTRQYGPIYGIFEGTRPIYVVSDADFLQEAYTKQFSVFHSRHTNILMRMFTTNATSLATAHGSQWRRQRHVINPTFSTAKLKMMTPLMNKSISSMMNKIDENIGNEFNIFVLYKRLTMDIIWHCAFGMDTDLQNDIDNMYVKKSLAIFARDPEKIFVLRLSKLMPFLNPLLIKILDTTFTLIKFLRIIMPSIMRNVEDPPQLWMLVI